MATGAMEFKNITQNPMSANQLQGFFNLVVEKGWPIRANKNIIKYIILQSYCSLWGGDLSVMQKYFFPNVSSMKELKASLEQLDLLGPVYGSRTKRLIEAKNSTSNDDACNAEPEYRESQRGKQCGHLFKKGESVYRCKNCGLDDTCVMCSKCFHATSHEGHHVKIWISRGGGCCDCGDPEAWKIPLRCSIHSLTALHQQTLEPFSSVPATVTQSIRDTVRVILNYVLETFAAVQENTVSCGTTESIKKRCKIAHKALGLPVDDPNQEYYAILWNDEIHSFDTVVKVLKTAINTDTSSAQMVAETVDEFGRQGFMSGKDLGYFVSRFSPFEKFKLGLSITTTQMENREFISFYLLCWLKDLTGSQCQFFSNIAEGNRIVRDIVCEVLAEDWELSPELAHLATLDRRERFGDPKRDYDDDSIDDDGVEGDEAQVEVMEDVDTLSENESEDDDWIDPEHRDRRGSNLLQASGLSSIIPMIINEDRELNEPVRRVALDSEDSSDQKVFLELSETLETFIEAAERIEVEEKTFAQVTGLPMPDTTHATSALLKKEFQRKTRLDYLLQFDLRLWKSVRNYIKDILINTFISNAEARPTFGVRFSRNYLELMDGRIFKEREPENSVTDLAVQLLTVPTVASTLVKNYNFFNMVCTVLKNYFPAYRITLDLPKEEAQVQVNCLSNAVHRQSLLQIISHLRFIMNADPVKQEIASNPLHLRYFLDMLYQFQEMDPVLRQTDTHVEFESRGWITAFGLTLQLVKLCNLFADSFSGTPTVDASRDLWLSIYRVLAEIVMWKQRHPNNDEDDHPQIKGICEQKFKKVMTYSSTQRIVEYDVTKEAVSLHRPYHWLLSKMLQHVSLLDLDFMKELGCEGGLKEMIDRALCCVPLEEPLGENGFMLVIEPAIRILATISQISCGVWVRNGFGIRNQARSYKDTYLRENTLDTDIHLLQLGFTVCDSDIVLLTLMDRFQVIDWFQGDYSTHPSYDDDQRTYMIEEFLNLLIICATEYSYISANTIEQRVRQYIIQFLGLSSMSFSQLVNCIPDSLCEHASFEQQLYQITNFKAPEGLTDKGLYELKPEYLDHLNPYFWHYTRNHQEEAQSALKQRWNQLHPDQKVNENEEFLLVPRANYIKEGPFKELRSFLHSPVFCQILVYSLLGQKVCKSDNILDFSLYLALVALLDSNEKNHLVDIVEKGGFPTEDGNTVTLLDVFIQCLDDQSMTHAHKRLQFIIEIIESKGPERTKEKIRHWREQKVKKSCQGKQESDKVSDYEKKKAAAKARQAAIMSQFANAQSRFMEQHADTYDSDEDEDMEELTEQDVANSSGDQLEVVRKCHFTADTCIVCQEDLDDSHLYGILGYVQVSNTQRLATLDDFHVLHDILKTASRENPWSGVDNNEDDTSLPFTGYPGDSHVTGLDASSCGHLMHASCFENFRKSVNNDMPDPLDAMRFFSQLPKTRFLCPLCKTLGNVLVPVVWSGKKETYPGVISPSTPYNNICESIRDAGMRLKKRFECDIYDEQVFVNRDPYLVIREEEKLRFLYNQFMRVIHSSVDQSNIAVAMNLPTSLKDMYNMYATTISDLENAQRGKDLSHLKDFTVEHTGTLIDDVPRSSQLLLKILSLTNTLLPSLMNSPWQAEDRFTKERLALQAINQYMPDTVTHLIEDMVEADNLKPLLMEDTFHALVRFSFALHEIPSVDIHHVLRSMYLAEITKTIIALASSISKSIFDQDHAVKHQSIRQLFQSFKSAGPGSEGIHKFATDILHNSKFNANVVDYFFQTVPAGALSALTRLCVLPFVRKAFIFMVVHHGFIPQRPIVETANELDQLSLALNLPLFDTLLDLQHHEKTLVATWCTHYIDAGDAKNTNMHYLDWNIISLSLPTKYKMVKLPHCMDDLLDESVKRKCTKCNTVPEHSAICLICGTFVCARHFCCIEDDKGECNTHMRGCGGDIGIYIMIKECFLLLLHDDGGHIMTAPYLDNHGEADIFFKHGARQYLNPKRYEQIRQLWLSQSIPSFVRRNMESAYRTTLWEAF